MPNRVQWDPRFGVGNPIIDAQHQAILAHCNTLADCLDSPDAGADARFLAIFEELKSRAREHFATEESLLATSACPSLEALRNEVEEYEYLEAEIVTAENFDRNELQTFLSLWWSGHFVGNARHLRPWLETAQA